MLRSHNFNCFNWQYLLVGLFIVTIQCDARAVNVSNTWTMPQEGLNVFYRFFRDRISWFEADAVCQFHHANLVTVDNSFQFDATRDLLRELDVNDIVWIGLMRPQSSDRFMWSSNSRPLVADTGYWAESLPLMDAPLCAVIDPIRDYRWHALRCGGPETASFLCEMPVPSWADACNLKDMPNLTLQYMADTASIELIRNCQEEGLLRSMCRGKQDRERAMRDLICPRERLEAQRINDITNSHFKSLQIINSIPSDNNENNDIELLPMEVNYGPHYPEELQTEKNTVQRLIEQFNVDELMQADEPSNMETVSSFYKIPGLIPKPVKKSGKKILDYNKKLNTKTKPLLEDPRKVKKPSTMDDMMMGDQPLQGEPELTEQFLNEEVSNEILEPLPHIKKTNIHKEDMEKMEKEAIALKKTMQKAKEVENKKMFAMMSSTASYTTTPTTTGTTTTEESKTTTSTTASATTTKPPLIANKEEMLGKEKQHDITTTASVSIGHPIHPQQQQQQQSLRNQQLFNEDQHQQQHNKEAADNSHFIPPMLLVKSHYVPPASKHGHNEHEHHTHSHHLDITNEKQHQIRNETETDFKETTIRTSTTAATKTTTSALNLAVEMTTLKSQDPPNLSPETDGSFKAIAQQPTTEEEKHKNLENLHSKETQTTITTTTSHPVSYTNNDEDSQKPATVAFSEITSIKDKSNKNEEEILELKTPQTINANTETTAATKLLTTTADKATENLFDLETTEPATKIVSKENEDEKVVVEETINSEAATQTPTEITAAVTTEKITENLKYTAGPDNDNKLALVADNKKEKQEERQNKQQLQLDDKKETIIKTTDILGISMASTTATTNTATETVDAESKTEGNLKKVASTTTTLVTKTASKPTATNTTPITVPTTVATASISLATTTTVKPITTTTTVTATMPQNEIKSTETSASSVSTTATNTNTNTNTDNYNENNSPSNTLAPSTARGQTTTAINTETSTNLKTLKTETSIETETVLPITEKLPASSAEAVAVSADTIEIATSIPPSLTPETTTRNFLKSTTETPFKPNRRRSLTKPETVSYMKKILG